MGNVLSIQAVDPKNWIVNRVGLTTRDANLVVTSNNEVLKTSDWEIFPNPSKGKVQISAPEPGKFILKVLDPKGRFVLKQEFENKTSIDLSAFQSGIYLLQIENQNGSGRTLRLIRK